MFVKFYVDLSRNKLLWLFLPLKRVSALQSWQLSRWTWSVSNSLVWISLVCPYEIATIILYSTHSFKYVWSFIVDRIILYTKLTRSSAVHILLVTVEHSNGFCWKYLRSHLSSARWFPYVHNKISYCECRMKVRVSEAIGYVWCVFINSVSSVSPADPATTQSIIRFRWEAIGKVPYEPYASAIWAIADITGTAAVYLCLSLFIDHV